MDFALGIFRQTTSLFMQKPRQSLSWTTYVDVFDRHLWLVLLSTIILAFLIFQVKKLSFCSCAYPLVT